MIASYLHALKNEMSSIMQKLGMVSESHELKLNRKKMKIVIFNLMPPQKKTKRGETGKSSTNSKLFGRLITNREESDAKIKRRLFIKFGRLHQS